MYNKPNADRMLLRSHPLGELPSLGVDAPRGVWRMISGKITEAQKNVSTRNRTCDHQVPACALTTILPRRSPWNMEVTSSTPGAVNFGNLQKFIARSVMEIDIWWCRHFLQFRPRRIHKKYKKPDPNPLTCRKPRNSSKFVKILDFRHESLRYRSCGQTRSL